MSRAKLFQSNRSQAVRLPKEVAFPAGVREVVIRRDGDGRVIQRADAAWDDFFAARRAITARDERSLSADAELPG